MKDRNKYLAAALMLLTGVGVLGATAMGGPATAQPPTPMSAAVQTRADEVFASFNGTAAERDAGALMQAYALNHPMAVCMASRGFPDWDWSLPRAQNPEGHGLESSRIFAAPLSHAVSSGLMAAAESIRADATARQATPSPAELDAIQWCVDSTPPVADGDAPTSPPAATTLREEWWKMLSDLDTTYGDLDAYAKCLSQARIPGLPQISSRDEAVYALTALQPAAAELPTAATDARAHSATWTRLVAAEGAWEAADWTCRSHAYNDHLNGVGDAVEQFAKEHAAQIADARQGWAELFAEAKSKGYRPGIYGPIGA